MVAKALHAYPIQIHRGGRTDVAQAVGMGRPSKLQRAGRDFLIRLVAKHGLQAAARILPTLADELEGFADARCMPLFANSAEGGVERDYGSR